MEQDSNLIVITIILGILLILLIVLSAIFSSSETAFTSVTKYKFDTYYKKKKKNWVFRCNKKLLNNYSMTLSTILVSNTLVNVAASTISTVFFTNILTSANVNDAVSLATGLATGVITFFILLFGEFIPKALARKHAINFMRILGPFIYALYIIFFPINWVLSKLAKVTDNASATEQELDTLIDIVTHEGVIESHEASLVSNALKFDETRIQSVMTKIKNVVTIKYNARMATIIDKFKNSSYSRIPVIKNKKIIGLINMKKVFLYQNTDSKKPIKDLIDPIISVCQYDTLDKVLQEMQVNQSHMAVVKKNQNSSVIVGIVTMENLLENLVGEIYDESDTVKDVTEINDFTWKVIGSYNAQKFNEKYLKLKDEINSNLTIYQWLKQTYKIKKMLDGKEIEKDGIKIIIRKYKNKAFFIIEKKKISY